MQVGESIWAPAASSASSSDGASDDAEETLEIVLHDACFRQLRGTPYEIDYGGEIVSGHADGAGVVRLTLRDGVERCTVRWARTHDGAWGFEREVHVGPIDAATSDGRDKLLHNLGFTSTESARRVKGFQILAAIEPSGDADTKTCDALTLIARTGRIMLEAIRAEDTDGGHRT
jgi:hypothetical protein